MKKEERLIGVDITVVACIESLAEKVMKQMSRELIIVFGGRANEKQNELYNQPTDGKDNDGDGMIDEKDEFVTRAKGGQSPHNFFCAVDCWVLKADDKTINWNNITDKKNPKYSQQDIDEERLYIEICGEHSISVSNKIMWGGNFKSIIDMPHWEKKTWRNVRSGIEKIIPNTA